MDVFGWLSLRLQSPLCLLKNVWLFPYKITMLFSFFFFCFGGTGWNVGTGKDPRQGWNLHHLQWNCGVLSAGLSGKSLQHIFLVVFVQSLRCVPTLWDPMDCSKPGFPVLHYLPKFAQTHVQLVNDAIQPSHSLSSPSPPTFNLSQHQGLFQWVRSSHQVVKVLELQLQSFQWIFRTDLL